MTTKKWTEWQLARGEHRLAYRVAFLVGGLLQRPRAWLGEQREFARRGFDIGTREKALAPYQLGKISARPVRPDIDAAVARVKARTSRGEN
jgi:hypothetical protein